MAEKRRCCGVATIFGKPQQCNRHGKYVHEGKFYCNYHSPGKCVERKLYAEQQAEKVREWADAELTRKAAREKWARDCQAALVDVADPIAWVEDAKRMLKTAGLLHKLDVYVNSTPAPSETAKQPQDVSAGGGQSSR